MISLGVGLWTQIVSKPPSGGDTTPGGAVDVLTDDNNTTALTDDDGTTYMTDD